jgi:CRISPR-associated protein (TIGR03986 family)
LRGRKFYRHHGQARAGEYRRAGDLQDDQNRTVRDALLPGAVFSFTVRFQNLAAVELGALLWSLEMDRRGVHRLGFGKPLGFGSVTIEVTGVRLLDTAERYASLANDGWKTCSDWSTRFVEPFKRALALRHAVAGFEMLDNVRDLRALLTDPPSDLPVHYPRAGRDPEPAGRNFEWFMGNKRRDQPVNLSLPADDQGLPLMTREGVNIA